MSEPKTATHRRIGGLNSRTKSVSVFNVQFEGGPQLKTTQQKSYSIPAKKPEDFTSKLKARTAGEPVFMAPDGTFYDINYVQAFKYKQPEKQPNGNSHQNGNQLLEEDDEEESLEDQLLHLYNSIPQIDEFENFFEYEQAFLSWRFAIETLFADIRLPMISGRALYRPKVSDYQKVRDTSTFDYRPSMSSFSNEGDSDEKSDPLNSEIEDDINGLTDSLDYDNINLKDLENSNDPWDTHLYPEEPEPADYDTFEEYNEALLRWASVCVTSPFFPPHPAQLKDLIPIQSITERSSNLVDEQSGNMNESGKNDQLSKQTIPIKSGIKEYNFIDDSRFLKQSKQVYHYTDLVFSKDPIYNSLNETTKKSIRLNLSTITLKIFTGTINPQIFYHKSPQPMPKIHGTLPQPRTSLLKPTKEFKNPHLRRTDLTPDQLKACQDSPAKVGGQTVQFNIPGHDIVFDHARLANDHTQQYASELALKLKTFISTGRLNHLCSWYYPMVSQSTHQKHRDDIDLIITSQHRLTRDTLTIESISEILNVGMYYDKFSDLIDASYSEDFDGAKTYANIITKCITSENVGLLLNQLENTKSQLYHAKMSALVLTMFASNQGAPILSHLIATNDVRNLSLFAYTIDYLSELPADLFPWSDETYTIIRSTLGDSLESIFKLTFSYYYLNIIGKVLDLHVHLYFAKSIINQSKVSISHSLANLLQNNTPNILDKLFIGIKHRSTTVSSFCLFVLLQLMNNNEGMAIHNCLKSESAFFFDRIKRVCDTRMKHVQFAARRLYSVLTKTQWIDFVYKEYTKDPETAVRDFIGTEEHRPSSLLLELTLDFFQMAIRATIDATNASLPISNTAVNIATSPSTPTVTSPIGSPSIASSPAASLTLGIRNKFLFVLDGMLFHTLFHFIIKNPRLITVQTSTITQMLAQLAHIHCKLGTVQTSQEVKPMQKRWGQSQLSLSPIDIRNLSSRINDFSQPSNPNSFVIRTNLVRCIRHLFKISAVYEIIRKEEDFYTRLLGYCRDGTSAEFNREAWKLLYQMTKNHGGTLETLSKDNILQSFMELVGTSSHSTVITNGLHYITKMFNINSNNTKAGVIRSKTDVKVVEKDLKALNSLFTSKRLFIKIHMIYKKYIGAQPGLAFVELARFYNTMYTSPNCAKLLKDTIKKMEYKEGLEKIGSMFDPSMPALQADSPLLMSSPSSSSSPSQPNSFISGFSSGQSFKDDNKPPTKSESSLSTSKTLSSFKSMLSFRKKDSDKSDKYLDNIKNIN
ncbi:hypothetical protein PPL_09138 [Heterostelium album PN500]|uniref:Uncharacterized protein n=1 Tax=Heterostelium pallidum (strain ATCC 26659 / Pp 5 / PN500) TaxID=670386 RepID=D3BKQ6_HETP5|nr:hypothetical protein PPL_09138 [Heterostelium album PN500]EFA78486.1 hypothetical protein PPL_09138 [Heterostelium album PN500]|eukprot:XP_020430610.1 hypothetical protein PPL_09138 [Heterostelium album PN500]